MFTVDVKQQQQQSFQQLWWGPIASCNHMGTESELFTGDMSKDSHSPGLVIGGVSP